MNDSKVYLKVKDHSVSGEEFDLLSDSNTDMLITTPQPTKDELGKYYDSDDYISHTDGRRNLFEYAYQIIKSFALNRKLKLINTYSSNGRSLLDVGCGTGDFLKVAKKAGWNVSGIEPNEKARQTANHKINGTVYDVEHLTAFKKEQFDNITLWHVLEHLPNLNDHLNLFRLLLKIDGHLMIAVPNYKSADAKYYRSHWAAFDVPRHLWHFSQSSMAKLAAQHHMKIIKTLPMTFDAYYVALLSEKYKTGKMNPIKAFWVAWNSNRKAKHSSEYSSLIYILKKVKN